MWRSKSFITVFLGIVFIAIAFFIVNAYFDLTHTQTEFSKPVLWKLSPNGQTRLEPNDGFLTLTRVKDKQLLWTYNSKNTSTDAWRIQWSPSGNKILVITPNDINVLDAGTSKLFYKYDDINIPGSMGSYSWSPDGKYFVFIGFKRQQKAERSLNTLFVFDPASKRIVLEVSDHIASRAAWAPDSQRILCNNSDHTVQIWDVLKNQKLLSINVEQRRWPYLAWSPDGNYIAVGDSDEVSIYDSTKGLPLQQHKFSDVSYLGWSGDGKTIISGDYDKPEEWQVPLENGKIKVAQIKEKTLGEKGYIPKSLDECFIQFTTELSPQEIDQLKNKSEKDLTEYHFGLGLWIRNYWGLWGNTKLAQSFHTLGVYHPDDISSIIITSYWRHLHQQPLELEKQAQYYIDYWKKEKSKTNEKNGNAS